MSEGLEHARALLGENFPCHQEKAYMAFKSLQGFWFLSAVPFHFTADLGNEATVNFGLTLPMQCQRTNRNYQEKSVLVSLKKWVSRVSE